MRFEDPLTEWLWFDPSEMPKGYNDRAVREVARSFDLLARVLDGTPTNKKPVYKYLGLPSPRASEVVLPDFELRRAEALYRRVLDRKGSGNEHVQESLLCLAGMAANPSSLPFWLEMLDLRRSRDRFSNTRRTYALAAIAFLGIRTGDPEALQAIRAAMTHTVAETRAMAVHYIARMHGLTKQPVADEDVAALVDLATRDRAFEARFMARRALASLGRPVPLDNPDGAYSFKVWHSWDDSVCRVLELSSQDRLSALHDAIQDAWGWDADHLYSFSLNGKRLDQRYEFAHEYTEQAGAYAHDVRIGELGLKRSQRFLYFFDFGDCHEFWVVVTRVRPKADADALPRVVESVGETIQQYPAWEE